MHYKFEFTFSILFVEIDRVEIVNYDIIIYLYVMP